MNNSTTHFEILGTIPTQSNSEFRQFSRVIKILKRASIGLDFCVLLIHCRYFQAQPDSSDSTSHGWKGEFDVIAFAPDRIIIYELKSGLFDIRYGRSDKKPWGIFRKGHRHQEDSWFNQASRQRYYLLQTYLNEQRDRLGIPEPNHFMVDSRIVVPNGSNTDGFYYKIPQEMSSADIAQFCQVVSTEDAEFIRLIYCDYLADKEIFSIHDRLNGIACKRLGLIFKKINYIPRVERWFQLIHERDILTDFQLISSVQFALDRNMAIKLAKELIEQQTLVENAYMVNTLANMEVS